MYIEKVQIKEMIVVEGRDDTKRIRQVVDGDTIETGGSAIDERILQQIAMADQVRGVIVLTDPDFAGEKIRKTISQAVPTAKHAFITRKEGEPTKRGRSLGVEHASDQAILRALKNVMTPSNASTVEPVSNQVLFEGGLIAGKHARKRRERLGELLGIGYTNGKQLAKRLTAFQISQAQLQTALNQVLEEEKSGV